jgi:isopentenyldiphosphate isomerase
MIEENVILVKRGRTNWINAKMEAHEKALLHRAFSVLL